MIDTSVKRCEHCGSKIQTHVQIEAAYVTGSVEDTEKAIYRAFRFESEDLKVMFGPIVYIARIDGCQNDGEGYLYIGSSKNGLSRICEEEHESLRAALNVPGAKLIVMSQLDEEAARRFEAQLIYYHQPILNKAGKQEKPIAFPWNIRPAGK